MKTEFIILACLVGGIVLIALGVYHSNARTNSGGDVVLVDGCQYIRFSTYMGYYGYCHKGNCTNAIHSYNR